MSAIAHSSRISLAKLCMQFAGRAQQPTPSDPYGLMGLLGVIRMQDPDLTTLALGTDLTGLGLHLNSPENVYSTFASPWAEQPLKPEPEFLVCPHLCLESGDPAFYRSHVTRSCAQEAPHHSDFLADMISPGGRLVYQAAVRLCCMEISPMAFLDA